VGRLVGVVGPVCEQGVPSGDDQKYARQDETRGRLLPSAGRRRRLHMVSCQVPLAALSPQLYVPVPCDCIVGQSLAAIGSCRFLNG
jgi:hypothetical protein